MSRLEDELRQALRRREPPAGFAERVLAHARQREKRRPYLFHWRWLAAATALIIVAAGLHLFEEGRRRIEGERAKAQVMLALRVTGSKLRLAQQHLRRFIGPGAAFQD
jgi:hypothetical protein